MTHAKKSTNHELMQRRIDAVPKGPFHVSEVFAARALGAKVWDIEGNEFIDFCGGIGVANVGHNHPKVVAAIKEQADAFIHTCFHVVPYEAYLTLAERLNRAVPVEGTCKTALFNSGAEAVENAVKTARVFTSRTGVVAFERGFHGRTLLTMSLTGKCIPYTAGLGPFAPEIYRLPYGPFFSDSQKEDVEVEKECRSALDRLTQYHIEADAVACLIVEPVFGEGGFHPIHPVAFSVLRNWCNENGVLLIADEVQTGFARCGALFACERYGLHPDLMTLAKSLGGGTVISALVGRADIMDAPGVGAIGGTYGGNPLACAAANAVLDIIDDEDLCSRANQIGDKVIRAFADIAAQYKGILKGRGLGAMCALECVDPVTAAPDPLRVKRICKNALDKGLLIMSASGNVIRTLMPLTIADADLDRGLTILEESIAMEDGSH